MVDETAVSGADAASAGEDTTTTGTDTSAEASRASDSSAGQSREPSENHIPISRAEEMWQKRQAKIEADYSAKLKAAEERAGKAEQYWQQFARSTGKALGFVQDDPPEVQFQKQLEERFSGINQTLEARLVQERQALREERLRGEWSSGWKAVQSKHSDYADVPGFDLAVMKKWSEDTSKDVIQIADEMAAAYEKKFAARQTKYAEEKAKAAQTRTMKPGGGVGSPSGKDAKLPTRNRIQAALLAARGE